MPTRASKAAIDIATRLQQDGFEVITANTVQRWREQQLLGEWAHEHAGGPGSQAVAPPEAHARARVAARLGRTDRSPSLVTLLAFALGGDVTVSEFAEATTSYLRMALKDLPDPQGGDPWDAAEELVDSALSRPRAAARLRRQATVLDGTPDPQASLDEPDRTSVERARSVLVTEIVALSGDDEDLITIVADAARLGGLDGVVRAAGLDNPMIVAELAPDLSDTWRAMTSAIGQLGLLDDIRFAAIRRVWAAAAGGPEALASLAASTEPIPDPYAAAALLVGIVLSEVGISGQLDAGFASSAPSPE